MKLLTAAAIGVIALNLGACATFSSKRTPEQRQEDRATLELLLKHCDLTANVDMELGLSARTGVGLKAGGNCGQGKGSGAVSPTP
jgi:hypothetical protein